MAKKTRPSLKDYLRTGVVQFNEVNEERESSAAVEEQQTPPSENLAKLVLESLSERDRHTWEPILNAGTRLESAPLDFVSLREEFRCADRNRFTYYLLAGGEEHLRPIRTSVQIREPVKALFKWDETGILTLYKPS